MATKRVETTYIGDGTSANPYRPAAPYAYSIKSWVDKEGGIPQSGYVEVELKANEALLDTIPSFVRPEVIYNLVDMGADMGDLMAKYSGNKPTVLAARNANAGLLVQAFTAIQSVAGRSGVVIVPDRIELNITQGQTALIQTGRNITVRSHDGAGFLKVYPDFQQMYSFNLFTLQKGGLFTVDGVRIEGPDHPFKVDAICCSYTPNSDIITRVSGQPFNATYHLNRTVDVNYYPKGRSLRCYDAIITEILSPDQARISTPVPSTVDPSRMANAGVRVDSQAHPEYLGEYGSFWTTWGERAGTCNMIDTQPATSTPGLVTRPGLITMRNASFGGAFGSIVNITKAMASVDIEACQLTSHGTPISMFTYDRARAAGDEVHLHMTDSEIYDAAYEPAGRNPAYDWSPVLGHGGYIHPNVNVRCVGTIFRDSKGTAIKHYASGNTHTETAGYIEYTDCQMLRNAEGFNGGTVGTAVLTNCVLDQTPIATGFNVTMICGSLNSAIGWIHGNFGSGRHLGGERLIKLVGTSIHLTTGIEFSGGYGRTGDPSQSFRILLEDCTTVIEIATVSEVSGTLISWGHYKPEEVSQTFEMTFEINGGTFHFTGQRITQLPAYGVFKLSGGARLIGEPTLHYWVDKTLGDVKATDYTLESEWPLLKP